MANVVTPRAMRNDYRPEIDGLRAVAVLIVIFFHFRVPGFAGGFVGVDVFFVVSGYLITRLIACEVAAGTFTFANFYSRRSRRILPALYVTVCGTIIAAGLFFTPADLARLARVSLWTVGFASNFFFWQESGYFDRDAHFKPLLHTWSLSVEEQFYFLWPALLLLLLRFKPGVVLPFILAIFAISLYLSIFVDTASTIFYMLPFRAHEFAIGALLAWWPAHWLRSEVFRGFLVTLGLALIGAATVWFTPSLRFPSYYALVPCVGAGLIIIGGRSVLGNQLLGNRVSVGVGKISYSLYLAHWPIYVIYFYHYGVVSTKATVALIGASFVLAVASYFLVESPFRRNHTMVKPLVPAAGALAAISMFILATAGLPQRIELASGKPMVTKTPVYGGESCAPRCESSPNATTRVYLLGDSHARAYYHGLKTKYPSINFIVHEHGGCEFYSDQYYGDGIQDAQVCLKKREAAWNEIAGTESVVLLGQHWWANFGETQLSPNGLPSVRASDLLPTFRTKDYLRDCPPERRTACASRDSRTSRW